MRSPRIRPMPYLPGATRAGDDGSDRATERRGSLQGRLMVLLIVLVAIIQFPTFLAVNYAARHNVLKQAGEELDRGTTVFSRLLAIRGNQLRDSVQLAASDFGFREAVASGDGDTVQSVLVNHGGRINASFALMLGLDGVVNTSTTDLIAENIDFPFGDLLTQAASSRLFATITALDGNAYQIVLAPVLAPRRIGWVGMGFVLDEAAVAEFRKLTALEISLGMSSDDAATRWTSTLSQTDQTQLAAFRPDQAAQGDNSNNPDYLSRVVRLGDEPGSHVYAVLQLPLAQALEPYQVLERHLTLITVISLLVSIIGAWLLARGVTQPLNRLMVAARRIGSGDYQAHVPAGRNDELGELASVFNHMQTGIADRERHIAHQAFHDALTGLPNRSNVESQLTEAIQVGGQTGTPVAVLMLDVNRFKEINDTLGHGIGDRLLIGIGERLSETIRPNDIIARLGGDEFLVVIPGADATSAHQRAEQIVRAVSKSLHLESMDLFPDVSVGIAMYPDHGNNAADLLRRSDIAMYDAKHARQPIAMYENGRDATHLRRLSLVNELRRAVSNDELCVYYQPKLAIDERTTNHVEALVRWQHPRDGLIAPDEFIPLAEHAGSIHLITDWVLRNVIRQCREWSDAGLDIGVAVNVSAMDLATGNLPLVVRGYLAQFGVAPSRLLLEITESAVMRDTTYALGVLNQLKACGVKLAIDDFGTGYSSLAHLKRLPVDQLKIDKSFVMNMTRDSDDAVIVRSTIELGHNMGLSVVAEGVEDEQAFRMLKNFHCDVAQGYLISRPLPADQITAWLHAQRGTVEPKHLHIVHRGP